MGRESSIEAARQLLQLEDRVRVISDVTRRFAEVTTNYEQLLESVAQSLAESLHDSCVVFLLTPDGQAVTASSVHATDAFALTELRSSFADRRLFLSKQPGLRHVVSTGQALLIPALDQHAETNAEREHWERRIGLHSVLVVPIRVQGRSIGVLTLGRHRQESPPFQHSDEVLAQSLADHAGLAIENARLFAAAADARRNAEQAHRAMDEAEAEHRQFFESSPNASFVVDAESLRIVAANEAALDLYGYSRAEFMQLGLQDLRYPEDRERLSQILRLAGNGLTSGPARHRHKDGSLIHVDGGSHLSTYEGRPARMVVLSDQTKRVQAEQERRLAEERRDSLEEQLRQAQKLEAVGRLAGGVAHDFNNVLSVILGYSQDVLDSLDADDARRLDVQEIQRAGQRAAELTRQLLMFSRQQVIEPKVLDLNEILGNMNRMLARILGERVELSVLPALELGRILADRSNLEQVIVNLAVNAHDAMPDGGQLTIETANIVADEAFVCQHLGCVPGPYVQLAVTDTGIGMDAATRARVFEPFFTTKEHGKGTGLGLSTVFGIVQQSGGGIWVYSEPGHGTTFKVYLPRIDADLDVQPSPSPPTELRGSETILLVEDEMPVREVARRILERYGYQVLVADSTSHAVLLGDTHAEAIQLLVTDVVMPHLSGAQLAQRLSSRRPSLKVLYMSGYTDGSIHSRGILDEGAAFLQKPFTSDLLARKVRSVLDGGA